MPQAYLRRNLEGMLEHREEQTMLNEYNLLGRMFGLAIYNSVILDVHFPLALYKKLHAGLHTTVTKHPQMRTHPSEPQMWPTPPPEVRRPHSLFKRMKMTLDVDDLAELDPTLARGLQRLLDMPREEFEEAFGANGEERSFTVDIEYFDQRRIVPLKAGGYETVLEWDNRQGGYESVADHKLIY